MLDIKKLSGVATGKITLLDTTVNHRITVRHGNTTVDIHGNGEATYSDEQYYIDLGMISQSEAEELVRGGTI